MSNTYEEIKSSIPEGVTLVAISKTKPDEAIMEVYDQGQRVFGENRVQELCAKYERLPKDIKWQYVGHLQRNKVKYIAPFVDMIQSVDSLRLLKEINKQAKKNDRIINCLLQFHIAREESKYGLSGRKAREVLQSQEFMDLQNVRVCGVMGMATLTDDQAQIRKEFRELYNIFTDLKWEWFSIVDHFKEVSMGMSGDYHMAIEEGSTMVRIGSKIFGKRD